MVLAQAAAAEEDDADGRNEEEDADDLEGQVEIAEEGHADIISIGVAGAGQSGKVIGGGGEGLDHMRDEDDESSDSEVEEILSKSPEPEIQKEKEYLDLRQVSILKLIALIVKRMRLLPRMSTENAIVNGPN